MGGRPAGPMSLSPNYDRVMQPSHLPAAVARRNGQPCPECGAEHKLANGNPSCDGHTSVGKACRNAPIKGGWVCAQQHGGGAPQTRQAATKRLAYMQSEGQLAKLLRQADIPGGIHPLDGLLEVVQHTGNMVRVLAEKCGRLDLDPTTVWETVTLGKDAERKIRATESAAMTGFDDRGNQVAAIDMELYGRWLRLYLDACKTALAADIDERLVRNATATSEHLYAATMAGLAAARAAGMTNEQEAALKQAMGAALKFMGPTMTTTFDQPLARRT